tara:strand:+ start:1748 stop:2239 length:492 start_codon:yes stop_codon:yes gene_type:complete
MPVKSATKKKLMDNGFPEKWAHILAFDRRWDDVKILTLEDIYKVLNVGNPGGQVVWDNEKDLKRDMIKINSLANRLIKRTHEWNLIRELADGESMSIERVNQIQAEYEIMKNKVPKYLPFAVPDVPLYFRFGQSWSYYMRKLIGESIISFINWPVKNPMEVKE